VVTAGAIVTAVGLVWMLQGLNVLGGSVMSGSPVWAIIGPIVLLIGLAVLIVGILNARRRRRGTPR
jgi:hypothetical protein